ncbi:MAG: transcriptional regulator GcvA [Rhodospirillaceae bacterium]|nr:transcriptional regulator GcvA [Rhodospirillaceae bacterium]
MQDSIPPLKSLRYFACAARHLSLSKAADELNVTHSAISHQIKALEEALGVKLFRRQGRGLRLTEAGQTYWPQVQDAFDRLADASLKLLRRRTAGPLTVTCMPSFAARWLVPHLGSFRARHPDIDVRIAADERIVDFARDDVDVAIRHGLGKWPGVSAERLLAENHFPVCSPKLLEGADPIREPSDLFKHTLLRDYDWRGNFWAEWFKAAGVDEADLKHALSFNNSALMLQAAIAGLGVALTQQILVADDLIAGRLIKPFDLTIETEYAYWLVMPPPYRERPKVAVFRDWIIEEVTGEKPGPAPAATERNIAPAVSVPTRRSGSRGA